MKRIATSIVTVALACLGTAVDAKAANNRLYKADSSPSSTLPSTTTDFSLSVTNDRLNGPTHPIKQIKITVPTGFTLVPFNGNMTGVTPPPHWTASVSGKVVTINTSGTYELAFGDTVVIGLKAKS